MEAAIPPEPPASPEPPVFTSADTESAKKKRLAYEAKVAARKKTAPGRVSATVTPLPGLEAAKKVSVPTSKKPHVTYVPPLEPTAPIVNLFRGGPSAPEIIPPAVTIDPKYQKLLDQQQFQLDQKEFKDHFDKLDQESKDFIETNFPGQKEIFGSILGNKEMQKIYDDDFYNFYINSAYNYLNTAKPATADPDTYENEIRSLTKDETKNPVNKNPDEIREAKRIQLAQIMERFAKENAPDFISTAFKWDKNIDAFNTANLGKLFDLEFINSLAPDKIALEFLANYETKEDEPLLNLVDQVDLARQKYENNLIDNNTYKDIIQNAFAELNNLSAKDPNLAKQIQKTVAKQKAKNIIEMDKFFDILDNARMLVNTNPNNAVSISLRETIREIEDDIKNGKIRDIDQLYKRLDTLGPVKNAIVEGDISLIEAKTKPGHAPSTSITSKEEKDLEDAYKTAAKEKLFSIYGIKLQGETSINPDINIYNLNNKVAYNYAEDFKNAIKGYKMSDFKNIKKKDKNELANVVNDIEDKLEKNGIQLEPGAFPVLEDIQNGIPDETKFKSNFTKFVKNISDINKQLKKIQNHADLSQKELENDLTNAQNTIMNEYQTKIDEEKDTTAKVNLENERDAKINIAIQKINDDYALKIKNAADKANLGVSKKLTKTVPGAPIPTKKLYISTGKYKSKPPKIIIPSSEAKEKAKKVKTFAEKTVYSSITSKHEPGKGKSYYGQHAIEYKVNTDEDLLNMKQEIHTMKGKLFIVDVRTGRLYPININDVFKGAIYVFQKDLKGVGGGFGKLKHSQHAFYPTLSNILRQEEDLIPYKHLRGGYDKLPRRLHDIPKNPSYDYRDQMRIMNSDAVGGGFKKFFHAATIGAAKSAGNYLANKTVNAAKQLAHQSVYEGKNFLSQEKQNLKHIGKSARDFRQKPNLRSLSHIAEAGTKLVSQPLITGTRELSNLSDFAGNVPGLNIVKYGAEYAIPGLAVADSAAHALKNLNIGTPEKPRYLDAAINSLDAALGTGALSGKIETGTKVINTGLKVADVFADKNHGN